MGAGCQVFRLRRHRSFLFRSAFKISISSLLAIKQCFETVRSYKFFEFCLDACTINMTNSLMIMPYTESLFRNLTFMFKLRKRPLKFLFLKMLLVSSAFSSGCYFFLLRKSGETEQVPRSSWRFPTIFFVFFTFLSAVCFSSILNSTGGRQ